MKYFLYFTIFLGVTMSVYSQGTNGSPSTEEVKDSIVVKPKKVLYGIASYYAEKFNGRKTANGEIYDGTKMTAACNSLPLGTWIRVTNLSNNRSVIVKTNDRLHPRMTRVVDLSRAAAEKLGFIKKGLTKVKVEVLGKKIH
ncbi:MAG: septal ring lytic transglycosylase RlpA family protein [Flavisolibacter sp.]